LFTRKSKSEQRTLQSVAHGLGLDYEYFRACYTVSICKPGVLDEPIDCEPLGSSAHFATLGDTLENFTTLFGDMGDIPVPDSSFHVCGNPHGESLRTFWNQPPSTNADAPQFQPVSVDLESVGEFFNDDLGNQSNIPSTSESLSIASSGIPTQVIPSACVSCCLFEEVSACDGNRPICSVCSIRGFICSYNFMSSTFQYVMKQLFPCLILIVLGTHPKLKIWPLKQTVRLISHCQRRNVFPVMTLSIPKGVPRMLVQLVDIGLLLLQL
jgi:hypothetical protein